MNKEQIIQEIKRIADEEGKPPGRQRFESLTGIGMPSWYGKYWARWGDALEEAGCSRNEKQAALEINEIMDAYLSLARELGRVSTEGELRLKSKTNPAFPAHSTFRNRLGAKSELLTTIIAYAEQKEEPEDLIAMLKESVTASVKSSPAENQTDTLTGFVYLMKSGRYFKIGKTNSLDRRRYEIGLQLPEGIEPVHSIETDDPAGIEAYWHNRFRDKRLKGEWFDLSPGDVRAFRRRKFM